MSLFKEKDVTMTVDFDTLDDAVRAGKLAHDLMNVLKAEGDISPRVVMTGLAVLANQTFGTAPTEAVAEEARQFFDTLLMFGGKPAQPAPAPSENETLGGDFADAIAARYGGNITRHTSEIMAACMATLTGTFELIEPPFMRAALAGACADAMKRAFPEPQAA